MDNLIDELTNTIKNYQKLVQFREVTTEVCTFDDFLSNGTTNSGSLDRILYNKVSSNKVTIQELYKFWNS